MNNSLIKHNTVYSSKFVRKESKIKTAFRVILFWTIPIAYGIHYRDKQNEYKQVIQRLENEIKRLDLVIETQARQNRNKQHDPQITLEHNKKIVKNGNNVTLQETKTYNGGIEDINSWLQGGF
jgi:hypothetical protein